MHNVMSNKEEIWQMKPTFDMGNQNNIEYLFDL